MAEIVNVHDAKTHLSRLLERVRRGAEITLAKAGKPVAKLVPLEHGQPRAPGGLHFTLGKEFFEPLPDEEREAWER